MTVREMWSGGIAPSIFRDLSIERQPTVDSRPWWSCQRREVALPALGRGEVVSDAKFAEFGRTTRAVGDVRSRVAELREKKVESRKKSASRSFERSAWLAHVTCYGDAARMPASSSLAPVVVVPRHHAVNSWGGATTRGSLCRGSVAASAAGAAAPTASSARSRANTRRCGTPVIFESRTRVRLPLGIVDTGVIRSCNVNANGRSSSYATEKEYITRSAASSRRWSR